MKNIYKFKKYNKLYPKIFNKEKNNLNKIIKILKIEHIGSTSIKDLGGKGVIDIIVLVNKKDLSKTIKTILEKKYEQKPSHDKNRLFFTKIENKHRFHLHLTSKKDLFNQAIYFRNHMKKDKIDRNYYEGLKKEALKICKGDGSIYRELKNDYIKSIIKKAKQK